MDSTAAAAARGSEVVTPPSFSSDFPDLGHNKTVVAQVIRLCTLSLSIPAQMSVCGVFPSLPSRSACKKGAPFPYVETIVFALGYQILSHCEEQYNQFCSLKSNKGFSFKDAIQIGIDHPEGSVQDIKIFQTD